MDAVDSLIDRFGPAAVTAALRPHLSDDRAARIERVLAARLSSVTAVLENLHDPHNGAAAIRSCEALGLDALHVVEAAEPFRFAKKVTIGCHKWMAVHRYPELAPCAEALRARGFRLYAAVPGAAQTLDDIDASEPVALVFGNELEGLRPATVAACDAAFSIPMVGFSQSFNLSVSVALCAYAVAGRRRAALGAPGDLTERERARRRARWYALSVRGAPAIVARHVANRTRADVSSVTHPAEDR
ncbi:MAG: TrmH family RNA methyltransferase [Deltaproteobacteria bacterium]|nr:MAG: TrmH family RNA methyltransferase [Deltaproteobacteria bacterium]